MSLSPVVQRQYLSLPSKSPSVTIFKQLTVQREHLSYSYLMHTAAHALGPSRADACIIGANGTHCSSMMRTHALTGESGCRHARRASASQAHPHAVASRGEGAASLEEAAALHPLFPTRAVWERLKR